MPSAVKTHTRPELSQHEWDFHSCYCMRCGRSAQDVVNHGLELKCHAPSNLTAISHIIAHRKMAAALGLADCDLLPNPLTARSGSLMERAQATLADQIKNSRLRDVVDSTKPFKDLTVYRERDALYGASRPDTPPPEPAA